MSSRCAWSKTSSFVTPVHFSSSTSLFSLSRCFRLPSWYGTLQSTMHNAGWDMVPVPKDPSPVPVPRSFSRGMSVLSVIILSFYFRSSVTVTLCTLQFFCFMRHEMVVSFLEYTLNALKVETTLILACFILSNCVCPSED